MLILRRNPDRQQVGRRVVRRDGAARLDRRGDQARNPDPLPDDLVGGCERTVGVSVRAPPADEHVVRRLFVQDDRAANRGRRVEQRRQLLDLEPEELRPVCRRLSRLRDHDRHGLTDVAHSIRRQDRVRDLDDLHVVARADDREGSDAARDLGSGEDEADAGRRGGGFRVDRDDPRVRVEAARESGVEHVRQDQVVDVAGRAGREADVLHSRQRPPDPSACGGLDGGHAGANSGSNGTSWRHSAPPSWTIVSAPS
jgi:hypothetical protein